jgi:hypothetical protein
VTVTITIGDRYYCQMPTKERMYLAYQIMCEELSHEHAKSAVVRAGRILKKYFPKSVPHDADVFIDDLQQIRYFHARCNGKLYTWKLVKIERKRSKHICKLYFRRLKNFVHANLPLTP